MRGLGFGVWGSGFGAVGLRLRVCGLGFPGFGFKALGLGVRVLSKRYEGGIGLLRHRIF